MGGPSEAEILRFMAEREDLTHTAAHFSLDPAAGTAPPMITTFAICFPRPAHG